MSLTLVTAPAADSVVISLDMAKAQCRLKGQDDDDDFLVNTIIPAAVDRAEIHTRRQLSRATWALQLDACRCSGWLEMPKPPLVSIESIVYLDAAGDSQTWAAGNYTVDAPAGPRCRRGRVAPKYGVSWPTTLPQLNAVVVTFVAGYGTTPAAIPGLLRQAMLMDIGRLYEHREDLVVQSGVTTAIELPGRSKQIYESFCSYPTQIL